MKPDEIIGHVNYIYHVAVLPGQELDFMRIAYQRNKKDGFIYPWVEKYLESTGGRFELPLPGFPETGETAFELPYPDVPRSHLITVEPTLAARDLGLFVRDKYGAFYPCRRMEKTMNGKPLFEAPAFDFVKITGWAKIPVTKISLVYELEVEGAE